LCWPQAFKEPCKPPGFLAPLPSFAGAKVQPFSLPASTFFEKNA